MKTVQTGTEPKPGGGKSSRAKTPTPGEKLVLVILLTKGATDSSCRAAYGINRLLYSDHAIEESLTDHHVTISRQLARLRKNGYVQVDKVAEENGAHGILPYSLTEKGRKAALQIAEALRQILGSQC